jgi:hypothetical protein
VSGKSAGPAPDWRGIPASRVVAVVGDLRDGRIQVGSGYLVAGRRVLTALHCVLDRKAGSRVQSLRVVRLSDGAEASARLLAAALDVAALAVDEDPAWPPLLDPVRFGRVDRTQSMQFHDCQAVGFPAWQLDPRDQGRDAAELHGRIRAIEGLERGVLVMRDSELSDVSIPGSVLAEDRENSLWGGLSGALVFHRGLALGVVIEHHPRQGGSALQILPVEQFAAPPADADPGVMPDGQFTAGSSDSGSDIVSLAATLALPTADDLPLVGPVAVSPEVTLAPGEQSADGTRSAGVPVTFDVIMRGPLHALSLIGKFDEATAQEQVDSASAASSFADIAEQLAAAGFTPYADGLRRRAVQAYATAGRRSDALRLQLRLVNEAILAGRWNQVSGQALILQQVIDGTGGTVGAGLAEAVAAWQITTTLLEDPVLSEDGVSAVVEATIGRLEAILSQLEADQADFALLLTTVVAIAVTVTEIAVGAEVFYPVVAAADIFDRIADAPGEIFADLRMRLRLAIAEAQDPYAEHDGRWMHLHNEAAGYKVSDRLAALVFGRFARAKAFGAASADADAAWRRAVEFGARAQLFSDSAGWLSAQRRLRHRYAPVDVKEIQDLGQLIQLLAAQTSDRLIQVGDTQLESLDGMRRGDQRLRSAALAAQRLRILSAAAGLWEEELWSHSLLADIFERSGEPYLAAFHRIRAGEAPSQEIAAHSDAIFIDVSRELSRPAPAERSAAYAMLAAQGDLIPDQLVTPIGRCAVADIEAVMGGKITESPFSGPGILRSAVDASAAVAGRLPADIAARLMLALDGRLNAGKGTIAWTDKSHLLLLAMVAGSNDDEASSAAFDQLSRLLAIDSPAIRGGGRSLGLAVRRRPGDVRRILVPLAEDGHDDAAEMLAGWSLTGGPGRAGSRNSAEQSAWLATLPFAERAADRLASSPAGTPGSASLWVHFARDAALVTILDPADVDRALGGLLRVAADPLHLSATRQQALDAASVLVAGKTGDGLGRQRLSSVFNLACEYARGEHDGSAMDELTGSAHPLSSWRIDMGDATLVADGLHLAARATRSGDQRINVLDLASAIVRNHHSETVLHNVARALSALGSIADAPASLSISALAQFPSQSLRAVAAIYWCKGYATESTGSDAKGVGNELARDPSPVVRRSMVMQLASLVTDHYLSPVGQSVINTLICDPLADIRQTAATILTRK